jgi:hypothetical protein
MSELDVIVIHIRAEQAAEYEPLFAERELPRWREYKEWGAFLSARIFRASFGTDRRDDIAKYVIAVEVPSHAEHSQHDADPRVPGVQPARRRVPAGGSAGVRRTGAARGLTGTAQRRPRGFCEAGDATLPQGFRPRRRCWTEMRAGRASAIRTRWSSGRAGYRTRRRYEMPLSDGPAGTPIPHSPPLRESCAVQRAESGPVGRRAGSP